MNQEAKKTQSTHKHINTLRLHNSVLQTCCSGLCSLLPSELSQSPRHTSSLMYRDMLVGYLLATKAALALQAWFRGSREREKVMRLCEEKRMTQRDDPFVVWVSECAPSSLFKSKKQLSAYQRDMFKQRSKSPCSLPNRGVDASQDLAQDGLRQTMKIGWEALAHERADGSHSAPGMPKRQLQAT